MVDIDNGNMKVSLRGCEFNMKYILDMLCEQIGGESGGHERAAGAIIPITSEKVFIGTVDKIINKVGALND